MLVLFRIYSSHNRKSSKPPILRPIGGIRVLSPLHSYGDRLDQSHYLALPLLASLVNLDLILMLILHR
jgi:hypothetical protein